MFLLYEATESFNPCVPQLNLGIRTGATFVFSLIKLLSLSLWVFLVSLSLSFFKVNLFQKCFQWVFIFKCRPFYQMCG